MRRVALLLLALSPACGGAGDTKASSSPGGGWTIVNPSGDRPTFHDLGEVPYGERVEHVFRMRNDDGVPVTIHDMIPSCGCAVPAVSYVAPDGSRVEGSPGREGPVLVVPPGAVAEVLVRVDTEHVQVMNLDKLATVRVRSDSKSMPYLSFELHLVVVRQMLAAPGAIELGQTPRSAGKSGRADVTRDLPGSLASVTGVARVEGPFTATVDETEIAGHPVWVVVASAKPALPIGPVSGKVVLSVTGEDGTGEGPEFSIPVSAQIAEDVVLRPPVFLFGSVAKGTEARVEAELVALVPGERLRVTGLELRTTPESAAESITTEATPIEPGEDGRASRWTIVLQTRTRLQAPEFSGTLVVRTDHPRVGEVRASVSGAVR